MLLAFILLAFAQSRSDVLFEDFEGDAYGRWTVTGDAFGKAPVRGTLPGQMAVEGFHGKGLVNSFHGGDPSTGTLTSPEFTIERKYISFLIGGGGFEGKTCLNLEVDGKVVRSAFGPNTNPGGSERLSKTGWDVTEFAGKTARFVIKDDARDGWGHINVDHIVFTDAKPPAMLAKAERTLIASGSHLVLPIKNDAPMRKMRVLADGTEVRAFDIELADGLADWWATLDVSAWHGKQLTLSVDRLPEDSRALINIHNSDLLKDRYDEQLRPLIHFSPVRGWTNDPNGLVYFNGTYHLFFQHNPYGWKWGNMHWGHATSKDLVHWEEGGEALYPDSMGPMFSGSAVVDWYNTSGFGKEGKPPLVLAYTVFGPPATQCLAYSNDGKTFTKYEKNPVLKEITAGNRDPKIIWHEPTKKWVMVLYVEKKPKHFIQFFTSPNLKDWMYTSEIDGFFECPDLFEVPIEGRKGTKKWVLTAADHRYIIGSFDGKKFTPETPMLPGHRGKGFYAAQTYSDFIEEVPNSSIKVTRDTFLVGTRPPRRVQFGWLQAPSPGMPFNQCMSLPLELTLRNFPGDGVRLAYQPAREVKSLRLRFAVLKDGESKEFKSEALEVNAVLKPTPGSRTTLDVRGLKLVYDADANELRVADLKVPVAKVDGRVKIDVFIDRTTAEVFANDGWIYVPLPFIPDAKNRLVSIDGAVEDAVVHELKSIWQK
jgi:fructan beta-fructosidase